MTIFENYFCILMLNKPKDPEQSWSSSSNSLQMFLSIGHDKMQMIQIHKNTKIQMKWTISKNTNRKRIKYEGACEHSYYVFTTKVIEVLMSILNC